MEGVFYSGYRVGSAGMPRVATQQPPRGEPASAQDAVSLDRGLRVFRTSRVEAAVTANPWAQKVLVELDHGYQGGAHQRPPLNRLCSSTRASTISSLTAGLRTLTTKSVVPRSLRRWRKTSRTRRFIAERATALGATRRPMTIPRRAALPAGLFLARTIKNRPCRLAENAPVKCAPPRSLARRDSLGRGWITPPGAHGPSLDGH